MNYFQQGASDFQYGVCTLPDGITFYGLKQHEMLYFHGYMWAKQREQYLKEKIN